MEVVVDFLTKMILTDEKYLRATPAHQVIRCAGHGLRQGPGTEASFVHSTSMKTINKFISHSWQASTGLKILTLQMFFNGKVAVLVGNLAALLGTALFSFGLLPGFEKVPRFTTEPILVAPWSLSAGVLSSLLMWIFWPPKEKVFLDRLCINQADPYEKTQGVLNIGACLKNSKSLLVILDDTYCGRLWCQFELAAFLKTHEDQDLVIQPMSLTFFILSLYFGNILLWYGSILVPFDSLFNTPIFAVGLCIHGWIIATAILWYMKEVDTVKSQLQGFSFAEASCWCCSVDHKGKAGERIPCDREIMQQCIQRWFGSTEQFEKSVQTRVKDALSLRLGGNFCTYPQLLAASLPALWANMDYTASRILSRDAKGAFSIVMSGVDSSINRGAIGLEDLNASGTATALLATTFDWPQPGDVGWFKEKLHLSWDTEVTLCAHLWSHQHSAEERNALWQDLVNCFAAPVLHFTGTPEFSQPNAAVPSLEPEWVTSVHAKLMLLEFHDRLRVVITSANLAERFWESNNEVVWIKDFPKVTGGNPLQRVLASEFSTVFSHFLVQILHKAPLQRLEAWLFRTLSFDLTCGAGVRLVASLPGEHLPARALQANQVVLRLSLEEEREEWEDSGSLSGFVLKTSDTGTWCLSREQSDSDPVEMQLDEMSLTALTAAAHFNFNAYSGETEVSLSTGGPLSINVEATRFSSDLEGSRAPVTKLRVLLKATEATHLDAERSHESLLELANFLALLEVDYGLRRHLAHEIWPSEQHYVAVTSAMSVPGAWWLHDLDRCCGRQEAPDPGPQLVLPRSRPRVPSGYRWIHESLPGKVVEHRSPDHAPGRQKIPNHSHWDQAVQL
eukprot:Skav215607  [mRNA]  locus=scaffold666:473675:482890:- [translate_table: standard]